MDAQLLRALPEREWVELDDTHPIFGTFFYVEDIYVPHPSVDVEPRYMAIFEDSDPTNDAYRLGVNYIIYGLTH